MKIYDKVAILFKPPKVYLKNKRNDFRLRNWYGFIKATLAIHFFLLTSFSNNNLQFWPIAGNDHGSDILFKPQAYIGNEFNRDFLVIGGNEGAYVVSPFDGVIISFSQNYLFTLHYSSSANIDLNREYCFGDICLRPDPRYISYLIGLEVAPGDIFYFKGLEPQTNYHIGTRISKGDTLGKLSYSYWIIEKPSLMISRSFNKQSADPMSALGLVTTFKEEVIHDPLIVQNIEKLQKDFMVFRNSLEEGHPGLYDYIEKDTLDRLFDLAYKSIDRPMNSIEFENILMPVIRRIRDNHTGLISNFDRMGQYESPPQLPISFGWEGDSLIVNRALPDYQEFLGLTITEINGTPAEVLKRKLRDNYSHYVGEGLVESRFDFWLLTTAFFTAYKFIPKNDDDTYIFTFSDGSSHSFYPSIHNAKHIPAWEHGSRMNRRIRYERIGPETAYLDLGTFNILSTEIRGIREFIREISLDSVPNLIIDIRHNRGGSTGSLNDIFSLIAREPFRIEETRMVKQNDTYSFFKYTDNYFDSQDIFQNYVVRDKKEGYWLPDEKIEMFYPDENIRYNGNIYLFADEWSYSAASVFAGLIHKYRRGYIIGRETGNPYHQMYANYYANVRLPNTHILLRLPLTKLFLTKPDDLSIPWGRGVLPHFTIDLIANELVFDQDPFLDIGLQLIADEVYLPDSEDDTTSIKASIIQQYLLWGIVGIVILICIWIFKPRRKGQAGGFF